MSFRSFHLDPWDIVIQKKIMLVFSKMKRKNWKTIFGKKTKNKIKKCFFVLKIYFDPFIKSLVVIDIVGILLLFLNLFVTHVVVGAHTHI